MATGEMVRLAAVGDIHMTRTSRGSFAPLFAQIETAADILLLAGDLTDYGLADEAHALASELSAVRMPIVAVLGNHDHESNKQHEISDILGQAGVRVLDGESVEVMDIGIAGVKGFAGGFGRGVLGLWGEEATKIFVREAINESLKLEAALARLHTKHRIALLHYSPILATVETEPREIWPYLGSSRLEEPLRRYPVEAVVHGHSHHGRLEGRLQSKTPVYNVSLPLLNSALPERPPFRIIQLPSPPGAKSAPTHPAIA
jgi:Icc-related predicted phosphoesterase